MSDSAGEERASGEIDNDEVQSGVLGSLPRSRPTVRSPRRQTRAARTPSPPADETDPAAATPEPKPDEPRHAADSGGRAHDDEPPEPGAPGGPEAEIEALAKAGVSLATGAATLGLRTAARAAAALRDAVERR